MWNWCHSKLLIIVVLYQLRKIWEYLDSKPAKRNSNYVAVKDILKILGGKPFAFYIFSVLYVFIRIKIDYFSTKLQEVNYC